MDATGQQTMRKTGIRLPFALVLAISFALAVASPQAAWGFIPYSSPHGDDGKGGYADFIVSGLSDGRWISPFATVYVSAKSSWAWRAMPS